MLAFYRRVLELAEEHGVTSREAALQVLVHRWLDALAVELSRFLELPAPMLVDVDVSKALQTPAPRASGRVYTGGTDLRVSLAGRWLAICELKAWGELEGGAAAEKDQTLIEAVAYWRCRASRLDADSPETVAAAAEVKAAAAAEPDEIGEVIECDSNAGDAADVGPAAATEAVDLDVQSMMPALLFDLGRLNVAACLALAEGTSAEPAAWTMGMSARITAGHAITEAVVGVLLFALGVLPEGSRGRLAAVVPAAANPPPTRRLTVNKLKPAPPRAQPRRLQPKHAAKYKPKINDENVEPLETRTVGSSSSGAYLRALYPDQDFEPLPCLTRLLAQLPGGPPSVLS